LLFFCDKPEDPKEDDTAPNVTTVAQDKESLEKYSSDLINCIKDIKNGDLVSTVQTMFDISQGEGDGEWVQEMVDSLEGIIDVDDIETQNRFSLPTYKGIYTYSSVSKKWTKTNSSNGYVVFNFPSQENGTNDLKLSLTEYSDKLTNFEGDDIGVPIRVNLVLTKNGQKLASFKLNSITWVESGDFSLPIAVDAQIFLSPLTIDISGRSLQGKEFDADITLSKSGCNITFNTEFELLHDDYSTLEDTDIDNVKMSLSFNNLKVTSNIDVNTLSAIDDPSASQVNSLLDIDVLKSGQKIADVELKEDSEGDFIPYLVYKDASEEEIDEAYATQFLDDLELALFDLLGDLD